MHTTLTAAVTREGDWFVSRCLEVEVASQGRSIDEALANLREALELYFDGEELPVTLEHPLVTLIEIQVAQTVPEAR